MRPEIVLVIVLAGLGTWGFRYLPTLLARSRPGGAWSRFLSATGPAAIAALTVAALLPELVPEPERLIPTLAGIAGVVLGYRLRPDVAVATLAGAAAYGIAFAIIGAGAGA